MLWPGHLALGYLVTKLLLLATPFVFSLQEQRILLAVGMIAALLPDLDFIPFYLRHRSLKFREDESHRKIWSHTPLLWALVIFVLIIVVTPSLFITFTGFVVLAGSWSHFLGDSIEYGVFWLWPFSKKKVALHSARGREHLFEHSSTLQQYRKFFTQVYIKNWTFVIEVIVIIVALVVAIT